MKRRDYIYIIYIASAVILILSGCSTKKNTAASRSFHETCAKYNINYNARMAYIEGVKIINSANDDDFTRPLPLFPASNHRLQGASSQMERTIEKSRKAIKKHSITVKPKHDKKRKNDPKYIYFYNQEEFVHGVKEAWIFLGKAEYYKGDFLGAASTFEYVQRHYPHDLDIVAEAQIWQARAYAEEGWLYEAEQSISRIKEKEVPHKLLRDYVATRADLYLKQEQNAEAIPYLLVSIEKEKNKYLRPRYNFILGRTYFDLGNKKSAEPYFKAAKKHAQSYQMEFNAELYLLQCQTKRWSAAIKRLDKMALKFNNRDYLDLIYTVKGDLYLAHSDTTRAIVAYNTALEKSTRQGVEKANAWIILGDLYYNRHDYVNAQPCYSGAASIITPEHEEYMRVSKRAEVLSGLVDNLTTITLQDSLQALALLPEEERNAVIDAVIQQLITQEKNDSIAKAKDEKGIEDPTLNRPQMNTRQGSTDWYFYNDALVRQGATLFRQKWGSRSLEDNWRRSNKAQTLSFGSVDDDEEEGEEEMLELKHSNDATGSKADSAALDPHKREYYIAQIPFTEEARAASDTMIAEALFAAAEIFEVQMTDTTAALEMLNKYLTRFPQHHFNIEALYGAYRIYAARGQTDLAAAYADSIIARYPHSTYAAMLSQPDYVQRTLQMLEIQDSIYTATYDAYVANKFDEVQANARYMLERFPQSALSPKFAFLDALTIGKRRPKEEFYEALATITQKYPKSDVTPMCKDILALVGQGLEAQKGSSHGSLLEKQVEVDAPVAQDKYSFKPCDDNCPYAVVLIPKAQSEKAVNNLLYDIAAFNFTKFMVKDYDIAVHTADKRSYVVVYTDSEAEADDYEEKLLSEPTLQGIITLDKIERIKISQHNLEVIESGWQHFSDYLTY